jgi:hypothetical protein
VNGNFVVDKFKNFNNCTLILAPKIPQEAMANATFSGNKLLKVTGYGPKIFSEIGKHLNYSIEYNPFFLNNYTFFYDEMKQDMMISVGSNRNRAHYSRERGITTFPFTSNDFNFYASRFKPYTEFEKIFLPFENEIWWWAIGSVAGYMLLNLVTNIALRKFRKNLVPMLDLM